MLGDGLLVLLATGVQVAGALILAAVLRHFARRDGRTYLQLWIYSWVAFAIFTAAAFFGRVMTLGMPATSGPRIVMTVTSLTAAYAQSCWLVLGTIEFSRRRRFDASWTRIVLIGSAGVAIVSTLLWIGDPTAFSQRYFVRVSVRAMVGCAAFGFSGLWLLRESTRRATVAGWLLPVAMLLYGVNQILLVFWALPISAGVRAAADFTFPFLFGQLDVFLQLLLGLGMLLWMLDAEQAERLASWRRLEESEERYRTLAEAATDAIVTIDEHSRIVFANRGVTRTFGYAPGELIGRPLTDLMPEADRPAHVAAMATIRATGEKGVDWTGVTLSGRHRLGHEIPVEVSVSESTVGGVRQFTGIARDISERKRMQEQLLRAQRLEAVGRLAGGIAHDFNNLLTAIGGYADLALDGLSADHPLRVKLLAFSRRQPIAPRRLNLNATVVELHAMLTRLIGEDVAVSMRLSAEPAWVDVDPGMIEQVLLNLAINARDAMPNGGRLEIETDWRDLTALEAARAPEAREGQFVCLRVADSGCGIAPDVLPKIFDPFFTTKDVGRGTGLGLSIAYAMVQQHGGWLSVESEPGRGSTFRVFLPRVGTPAAPVIEAGTDATNGGRETVLLAEDEDLVRRLVREALRRYGYEVIDASNGPAALDAWATHADQIALLITDVVMPGGMTGVDVALELRKVRPTLPVVLMSGYHDQAVDAPVPDAGHLPKPFEIHTLLKVVRERLDAVREARR